MKALSLWQPWATLIAIGAKRYETRSWSTSYRGPLIIHAAKSTKGMEFCDEYPFQQVLFKAGYLRNGKGIHALPMGAALCVVDLVAVVEADRVWRLLTAEANDPLRTAPSKLMGEHELDFGDYSAGRYAWQLENVRLFHAPIPMKGAQGLFEVDEALIGVK